MASKFDRRILKRILWVSCVMAAFMAFVVGGYLFLVVGELKTKLAVLSIQTKPAQIRHSVLEKGSMARMETLSAYMDFVEGGEKELEQSFNEGSLVRESSKVLVEKDTELPPMLVNQCERYSCMQNRVAFSRIPSSLWKGLLGIEDYRFLQHRGVDPVSIARALVADIKAMSLVQGGSTLTQQLAKNLFLSNEKKLERKLREVIYALYLEQSYSKEQIVTMYFNEVFWGTMGGVYIKGVHMASRIYFGKSPAQLDDFEAAMLIGMLKGPYYYHPLKHLERLKKRTNIVFKRLRELRLVSSSESLAWSAGEWNSWQERLKKKSESSLLKSLYYTSKNSEAGLDPYEKLVFYEAVARTRKALGERTEGADVAVKAAIVDSSCESAECENRFTYYSKFERDLSVAINKERHQVGSVLKPIIYQQLLEEGKSLDDEVSTAPITITLPSGKWTPSDSSKDGLEQVTLRYAIQKSRNIPLVRASQEVGFDALEPRLLGYFPNLLTPLREYPAQLLGAIELSLGELSGAYLKFFRNQCESFARGESKYEESLLYHLAQADETTIARVAGRVIKQSLIFGKTGTTNNGLDNWYIAYDGQNFYSIWFGVDSNRDGKKLKLYGSNSAFRIFQDFIQFRGKQVSEFFCR